MDQKTVGDVIKFVEQVTVCKGLFGSVTGFTPEFERRARIVGRAICDEQGIMFGTPGRPPSDTPLGEESSSAFQELLTWYDSLL